MPGKLKETTRSRQSGTADEQRVIRRMGKMLELDGMKRRIDALISFRAAHDKAVRSEAILPLYRVFAAGPASRREFAQMTDLGEHTARSLTSRLLHDGLLVSDSASGPVRWGLKSGRFMRLP